MDLLQIITDITIHTARAATETEIQSPNILGTLGINGKIFIAQLINFAVILFVLWKYAFTPVANKLQERTDRIEKSIHDAGRIEREKQEFEVWKNEAMKEARKQASAIITQSKIEAEKSRKETIEQTKVDQLKLIEQAKTQIEAEKTTAVQSAKSELADIITYAAEKILRAKLDEKKDAELIKEYIKSIK